jgi:large subunit ribosomal protein L10
VPNIVNQMVVKELTDEFKDADGMVVATFNGLTVQQNESLRDQIAAKGAKIKMVQNRLARIALRECGFEFERDQLKGNTAIAYGSPEGAIGAAKVLTDPETKKLGKVKITGGMLEGDALDAASATALASVPDRDTLNAQLLGVISGPARALASVINAVPSSVARVLQAHADQEGDGEEG